MPGRSSVVAIVLASLLAVAGAGCFRGPSDGEARARYFAAVDAPARLTRQHGRLVLELRAPAHGLRVHASTQPDPTDWGAPIARLEQGSEVELRALDPALRHYLRVESDDGSAFEVAERRLPLEGAQNFRDLGGYRTADGRWVAWGHVYRSDALHELTDPDLHRLERAGIRLVCDFRSDDEVADEPSRLPAGAEVLRLPIEEAAARPAALRERIASGDVEGLDASFMLELYATLLDEHARAFGAALARIAAPEAAPTVVHCTAGKDRTGILSALLLLTLGVPEPVVLGDYALTELYAASRIERASFFLLARGIQPASLRPLIGADPEVLRAALAYLRDRYGSIDAYLTGPAGLAPAQLTALRIRLLRGRATASPAPQAWLESGTRGRSG